MHFHIHWLIHTIRHARLLGWNLRFLGTALLMVLCSVFQFGIAEPDSALTGAKESRRTVISIAQTDCTVALAAPGSCGLDQADPRSSAVLDSNTYPSVFSRLKPGIYLIPRKDRLPKPKSVYRIRARAPGGNSVSLNEGFHRAVS